MEKLGFDTRAVHGDVLKEDIHRAIRYPIYAGVAFHFESAEDLEDAFAFRLPAHAYSRVTNPTVEAFERKMNGLENGRAAVATASGMAAISNVFFNLLTQGENIVSANSLFGNTYSFFKKTLKNKELYLYEHRLLSENPATLQEIGDNYGITRERARQIEEKLLKKIKTYLEQESPGVEDYPIKIGT